MALTAGTPRAGAQVVANQPATLVTAAGETSAPVQGAGAGDFEKREVKKRGGGTAGLGGLSGEGRDSGMAGLWIQTGLVLGVVLALMWLVLKWLGKRGIGMSLGGGGSSVVQVLHRGYLSGRHQLVLVRFGGRILLLGVSPQGVNVVSEVTSPEESARILGQLEGAKAGSATNDFQQAIQEAAEEYTTPAGGAGVVATPSREQIVAIRGEIRNLLAKMQSLGKKPQN